MSTTTVSVLNEETQMKSSRPSMPALLSLLMVLVFACVGLRPAYAQTTSGSISGEIVDATHSAVPNAAVTAIEQDKKFILKNEG